MIWYTAWDAVVPWPAARSRSVISEASLASARASLVSVPLRFTPSQQRDAVKKAIAENKAETLAHRSLALERMLGGNERGGERDPTPACQQRVSTPWRHLLQDVRGGESDKV
eukprot:scaffold1861_cov312-Pinguiococcus_pyrenoidosus.AAC.6